MTKKTSTCEVAKAAKVAAKSLGKRRAASFGVGLKATKKTEVPDRTSEAAAATLPPVPEGTGGESSVSGTEDTSVSGTEVLTGSRAVDPSDESGSRTGNDYPTDSKGESPVESPKKTIGKESGQVPAEAGRRPKNKIPRKAETLRRAAEATQKFIENRRTQGDLEADEETQGVLSDEQCHYTNCRYSNVRSA
jgi:hypothetical protein